VGSRVFSYINVLLGANHECHQRTQGMQKRSSFMNKAHTPEHHHSLCSFPIASVIPIIKVSSCSQNSVLFIQELVGGLLYHSMQIQKHAPQKSLQPYAA
jgi:hypothetical protein